MKYVVNYQHRGGLPISQKSQWRVSTDIEISLFNKAVSEEWICPNNYYWSIENQFSVIGEDLGGDLYVAKFWSNQDIWHGFPVSTKRQCDRPPTAAILAWVEKNIIRKRIGNKMAQGQF